jgi:recombination protein RecT
MAGPTGAAAAEFLTTIYYLFIARRSQGQLDFGRRKQNKPNNTMNTNTQLATKKHPQIALLESKLPDVRNALPPNTIEAEKLEVAFRSAFNRNPKLLECSPMSICAALVNCATLGIVPNTPEQHAYLIPRKRDGVMECNFEIGYRGFCHMMLRTGHVSNIKSGVVHKGDTYKFEMGANVVCEHSPNLEIENRDAQPIIAAYCLITFRDGQQRLEMERMAFRNDAKGTNQAGGKDVQSRCVCSEGRIAR